VQSVCALILLRRVAASETRRTLALWQVPCQHERSCKMINHFWIFSYRSFFFQACCLCAIPWGPLKRTSDRRWAHLLCALAIYEVNFMDEDRKEPINVHNINPDRLNLVCAIKIWRIARVAKIYFCSEMLVLQRRWQRCFCEVLSPFVQCVLPPNVWPGVWRTLLHKQRSWISSCTCLLRGSHAVSS
jgi:PHD-zinc-finger like domain